MIDLKSFEGMDVEIVDVDGNNYSGYVDAFCAAEDNDDYEPSEQEDGICLQIDDGGGVFMRLSQIKDIIVHN
ncbi:MAG: hypothetical protein NC395_07180 [Prevotella sp.]|nr:hypothetical protein [Prevotella sp.]